MKTLKILAVVLLLGLIGVGKNANAQQDAAYSMYMFNGLYLNPAYAGSKEFVSVRAIYRHQWTGFEGAPRTASFAIHTPFKQNQYAAGLWFTTDHLGVTDMNSIYGSFAYRFQLPKGIKLSLGLQAGVTVYNSNLPEATIIDPADQTFAVARKLGVPNFGFGIYAYNKRWYAGFSIPHLINSSLNEKLHNAATEPVARQWKHYLLTAGVVIGKEESVVKFKPSFLYKAVKNTPPSIDLNFAFLFIDRLWLAAGYRIGGDADKPVGESIIGMVEFKVTPQLNIGYAYDANLTALSNFNSGTHEIMVGYDFGFERKRFVTPRYVRYF